MTLKEKLKTGLYNFSLIVAMLVAMSVALFLVTMAIWGIASIAYGVREVFGWNPMPEEYKREAAFERCEAEHIRKKRLGRAIACQVCEERYDFYKINCDDND